MSNRTKLSDEQRVDWLRLIRSDNIGPRTFHDLVEYYGGVRAALTALPDLAKRGGSARSIRICSREQAEAELQAARATGIEFFATGRAGLSRAIENDR